MKGKSRMNIFCMFKPNVERLKLARNVRGLLKALRYKSDTTVRLEAAQALIDFPNDKVVEALIQALEDADAVVRKEVVQCIGHMGSRKAVGALISLAQGDQEWSVRHQAIQALVKIGDPIAIKPLAQLLDKITGNEEAITEALAKLGAVDILLDKVRHHISLTSYAEKALVRTENEDVLHDLVAVLIDAMNGQKESLRSEAAKRLGTLGKKEAVIPLVLHLKADCPYCVRPQVAEALKKLKWVPSDDTDRVFYLMATRSFKKLKKLGDVVVKPLLDAFFYPCDTYFSLGYPTPPEYIDVLIGIGDAGVPSLLETFYVLDSEAKRLLSLNKNLEQIERCLVKQTVIVLILGGIGDTRAADPVLDWLFTYPSFLESRLWNLDPEYERYRRCSLFLPGIPLGKLFGDYAELLIDAASCSYTYDSGEGSCGQPYNWEWLPSKRAEEAVRRFCQVNNSITTNILHKVKRKTQTFLGSEMGKIVFDWKHGDREADRKKLNDLYESERRIAREELCRRGNPPFDPTVFLDRMSWRVL